MMPFKKLLFTSSVLPLACFAGTMGDVSTSKTWSIPLQGGFFVATQNKTQHIDIDDLVGNQYTNNNFGVSGLAGVGLYLNGPSYNRFQFSYGIDVFYLAQTTVRGEILEERVLTNLSYEYTIQNAPFFAAAKVLIDTNHPAYNITFDAGIGPDFMWTSGYHETPLTDFTTPRNVFGGAFSTSFSVTAGAGIRFNNIIGNMPLECGYRFFYLGQGYLNKTNDLYLNNLNTGDTYVNALLCAVTV